MIPYLYQKKLAQILVLTIVSIHYIKANFNQKNVIQIKEDQTFILTNGFEEYRPQIIEENILQINATKDSDYFMLSAYNITDYSHSPTVFITSTLQMLQDLFHFISMPTMPSNITYINCTLSYSQQCIINNQSIKIKEGNTFYLIFVGVGVNRHSFADIKSLNLSEIENDRKLHIDVNGEKNMILFSAVKQKKLILQLQEHNLRQFEEPIIGQINVYFLHSNGELLGDNKFENDVWNHGSNKIILQSNNQQIPQDKLIFQSQLSKNRQHLIEFDLQQISSVPIGQQRNLELHIEQDYNNTQIIGVAVNFIAFSQNLRVSLLTAPIVTTLLKNKDQHKQIYIHYMHPLFEYLASEDKENDIHAHFKPPQNYKFFIYFDIQEISSHPQSQIQQKLFYNKISLHDNKPDESFTDSKQFKIDVHEITKKVEEDKHFQGSDNEENKENHTYSVKSNLKLELDKSIDINNNNNQNNNNNNDINDQDDDQVLILIVVFGVSFIIISTLVYVKCFSRRNSDLQNPQKLEEIGEEHEKQNDIEKANSNDSSGNNSRKPQSTKSSTKTNGNHMQLVQEDDKSALDYLDNHHNSTDRKSHNRMQSDLSSNALKQDKSKQGGNKKPPMRKKNIKNHLRIEIEDSSYENTKDKDNGKDKEAQQKLQQLKMMQQQALKQKQRQKEQNK